MSQYAGCRKDVPCSHESTCFYQSTRKCAFFVAVLCFTPPTLFFCNCGGSVRTRLLVAIRWVSQGRALLARVCLLLPKHTQVCFFCCRFVFHTTDSLFLKVLVEDKIFYGVNAMKFNVDMPFCLFTKTVQ